MKSQKFALKHGKKQSAIYVVHRNMMNRCYQPNDPRFPHYGGRGITVDPSWHDFSQFYADMGDPPKGLTLERCDNNLGYSKANCRWATKKDQSNNRRFNKLITFNGITLNQKQWAEKIGIDHKALHLRFKAGWSIEDALTRPLRKSKCGEQCADNVAA